MLHSKYRFSLDIKLTQSQVSIPVMLNDTIWGFYINLIDNGKPFLLPDGCRAVFVAKKPDGNTLFNDCIIEGNHIIRYDFTANTTNAEGMAHCEIRVYSPSGRLLTCPRFTMVVDHRVLLDDEIVFSESEHTTLDSIIASEYARQQAEIERSQIIGLAKLATDIAVKAADEAVKATDEAVKATEEAVKAAAINGELVREHNIDEEAHDDIRKEINSLHKKLCDFLNGDDETLDELSEIVGYIHENKIKMESFEDQLGKRAEAFTTDGTLSLNNKVLSVNMATEDGDRTLPISAAEVDVTLGNIGSLLEII